MTLMQLSWFVENAIMGFMTCMMSVHWPNTLTHWKNFVRMKHLKSIFRGFPNAKKICANNLNLII